MSRVPLEVAQKINAEMGIDGINLQQGLLGFKEAVQAASAHSEPTQPQPPSSSDSGLFDFDPDEEMEAEVDDTALAAAVKMGFEPPKDPGELPKLFVAFHKAELKRHKCYSDAVKKSSIKKK
jgi:hypothetical protein